MKKIFIFVAVPFLIFSLAAANAAEFAVSNATQFQEALNTAAQNGQDDTINVAPGTLNLANRLEYLTSDNHTLTIQGAGAGTTVLNGGGLTQIFYADTNNLYGVDNNAHITIRGLTFTNGAASAMPGGGLNIFAEYANISLENCVFTNNIAGYGGGADIETYYGTITVTNNIFNQNSSDYDGGGAYISGETVTLTDNIFTNNSIAGGYGGGLAFSS
jgi:hypothetical protein